MRSLIALLLAATFLGATPVPQQKENPQEDASRLRYEIEKRKSLIELKEKELEYFVKLKIAELQMAKLQEMLERERNAKVGRAEYTENILVDGRFVRISDRSIHMPVVINYANSMDIAKRISFFNRKNSYPIFIVVDICAGGSVMGGDLILRAIASSRAKVYIVVKTYCASMCAIIVSTYADQAYVFRSATILHHELRSGAAGNTTFYQEYTKRLTIWQNRLFQPITARIGTTPEKFVNRIYELNRTGDAALFAEEARDEKWVINLIDGVIDESFDDVRTPNTVTIEEDSKSHNANDVLHIAPNFLKK